MNTITIRELHDATGRWVRRATALGEIQVTEHGRIVAKLVPAAPPPAEPYFARQRLTRAFRASMSHLKGGADSTRTISEDRDRRIL